MGEYITRTRFPKQRDFARFVLKREWADVFRIKLAPHFRGSETIGWCKENCAGRWSNSDGFEVFYFENIADATLFRLRWSGNDSDTESSTQSQS